MIKKHIILLGVAALAFFLLVTRAIYINEQKIKNHHTSNPLNFSLYNNQNYNFTFSFPSTYEVIKYTPENLSVVMNSEGVIMPLASIQVRENENNEDLAEFAYLQVQNICNREENEFSVSCTGLNKVQEFKTINGVHGVSLSVNKETTEVSTEIVNESTFGPVFALKISNDSVLIITPPSQDVEHDHSVLLYAIAESVSSQPLQ